MKAVVLHEYGGPEKLKYEDVADPVAGEGEVLVRQAATSINPIDWKMRSGAAKERYPLEFPAILGRDIAGVIKAVGPGVTGFAPGDKVIALGMKTYAELVVVKAAYLARLPKGMDLVEAAALPLVAQTGEQLMRLGVNPQQGQTVLVSGAPGGVGRTAVWVAQKGGAKVIAGVRRKQLKDAGELKADEVVALDDEEAMAKLGFVDAVADTVGGESGADAVGEGEAGRRVRVGAGAARECEAASDGADRGGEGGVRWGVACNVG